MILMHTGSQHGDRRPGKGQLRMHALNVRTLANCTQWHTSGGNGGGLETDLNLKWI